MKTFSRRSALLGLSFAAALSLLPLPVVYAQSRTAPAVDPQVVASSRPLSPMPSPGHMPGGSFMEKIQQRGKLVVGVSADTMIMGFQDPTTGEFQGFDVDILRAAATAIFGDWHNHIEYVVLNSAQRIDAIKSGQVDMLAMTMTINADRKRQIGMSTPYFVAGQRVLVNRGAKVTSIEDLRGQPVCAANGSTSLKALQERGTTPVGVADWTRCLVELQLGHVRAVSTDNVILMGLAAQDATTELVGDAFTAEPYGVAVSLDHPELLRFVNGVLQAMFSDGRWETSYQKWMGKFGPTPTLPAAIWSN